MWNANNTSSPVSPLSAVTAPPSTLLEPAHGVIIRPTVVHAAAMPRAYTFRQDGLLAGRTCSMRRMLAEDGNLSSADMTLALELYISRRSALPFQCAVGTLANLVSITSPSATLKKAFKNVSQSPCSGHGLPRVPSPPQLPYDLQLC